MSVSIGKVQTLDWTTGLDYWNGLQEWIVSCPCRFFFICVGAEKRSGDSIINIITEQQLSDRDKHYC